MQPIRVVAIPTEVARAVRATRRAPVYGHPAHEEVGSDAAPCRHCLRLISPGKDARLLFTYDRFAGVETLPLPGPVFIHADDCERYPASGGFPAELRSSPRTLEAFARGRNLLGREYVKDGNMEAVIADMFSRPEVDYINVSSTTAGCFTFRIERQ
jgi:hypothetical protein